jgi:hypothetical protein
MALAALLVAGVLGGCSDDDDPAFTIVDGGVFNTPVGAGAAGPATPGDTYRFTFTASAGHRLSFATMYVQSNDLFFAPAEAGIALYDAAGSAVTGDVTSQVLLVDAGTEVNQEPGVGSDQPLRQAGPDTGADENGTVQAIADVSDGFTYPAVSDVLSVSISESGGTFTVDITVAAASVTPLAPGVYVVHTGTGPLFTRGTADRGQGLEALAEDGDASTLATSLGL